MKYSFVAKCRSATSDCTATMRGHVYLRDGEGDAIRATAEAVATIRRTTPGIEIVNVSVHQLKAVAKKKG